MKSRSSITHLILFKDFVSGALLKRSQVYTICTYFTKAFDRIGNYILLNKSLQFGVDKNHLKWLASYLHNRKEAVRVSGSESAYTAVASAVPDGSHFIPTMFILFINDPPSGLKLVSCLLFANDGH